MERFLFLMFAMVFSIALSSFAQNEAIGDDSEHTVYCEIVGFETQILNRKLVIEVDFGQEHKLLSNQVLVDENGKQIKFNSMVDAMNFLGNHGWKVEQTYAITHGNSNVYHFLLSKKIVGNDIQDGLKTKSQYRKEQRNE